MGDVLLSIYTCDDMPRKENCSLPSQAAFPPSVLSVYACMPVEHTRTRGQISSSLALNRYSPGHGTRPCPLPDGLPGH